MALGDTVLFDESIGNIFALKSIDMDTDVFDVMLVTNAVVPTRDTVTPAKLDFTEVTGGTYAEVANIGVSWTEVANVFQWVASNPTWASDASGPTNIYYAIVYDETATLPGADPSLLFVDLAGPKGTPDGDLTIKWSNGATQGIAFDVTMT